MAKAELAELIVADAEALRAWLTEHHAASAGVWLALTKKGGTVTTLTWQQAVDEALCFGWIDGVRRSLGDEAYSIRFTPRKPTSIWSAINVDKVEKLTKLGKMLPAGSRAFAARRADIAIVGRKGRTAIEARSARAGAGIGPKMAWEEFLSRRRVYGGGGGRY